MAVGIVVAALGTSQLIAMREHRYALREGQDGQEIPLHSLPHVDSANRVGGPLDTPVATQVVIRAVPVVLAVGKIVLGFVADQIMKSEAVVTGHEVDAGLRTSAGGLIQVAATG